VFTEKKTNDRAIRVDYESLPSLGETLWQLVFFLIVEDFCFYWSHRVLHWGPLYRYIHKTHHEYKNTIGISSEYAHPVEFIFGNILSTNMGGIILGSKVHALTFGIWIIIRIVKTTEAHSGFQFPWSPSTLISFTIPSDFHNYHHETFTGNYGSFFTWWDNICNTVSPKYLQRQAKKLKDN